MGGKRDLLIALSITLLMMIAEVIGGLLANSLALLSDAGHMLTDNLALLLSFFAMKFATMPATEKRTFGFYRLEILAALINGIILVVISLYIIYQAYLRMINPQRVEGMLMLIVAVIGLVANIIGAVVIMKHSILISISAAPISTSWRCFFLGRRGRRRCHHPVHGMVPDRPDSQHSDFVRDNLRRVGARQGIGKHPS
jgi:cation diffusion facilitator family transporter